jgi:type II secretory pathway pseudopilin PulG
MMVRQTEGGFTIVEMVVTLVVMSLFLTMLFQLYSVSESQRQSLVRRAAAEDLATTNLNKFTKKANLPQDTLAYGCDITNDLTRTPTATGTPISKTGVRPWIPETAQAPLPTTTKQELLVLYPKGCSDDTVTLISIVSLYEGTESVRRAVYIH